MYEIWLALNIVYEIALGLWPELLILLGVWLFMLAWRWRQLSAVPAGRLLGVAIIVALIAALALPALTLSGFANFGYWVDWLSWLGMALGFGMAAALCLWPWMSLRRAA